VVPDSVIMPGMRDLLDSGDIGAAGVSNYSLARWQKADAALGRPVISNQVHFSLANPGALIERDAVQLQPARAGALAPLDHRWERRVRQDFAGHHNVGAPVAECFAEDALAFALSVYLGRAEQRHPQGKRPLHDVACGARSVLSP
jgi:hypothetical protein